MKKFLAILMTVVMLVSLTACSVKMPANLPIENAITNLPESVTLDQTDVWPENAYTENVPQPTGKVLWTMIDKNNNTCGVTVRGISKDSIDSYMDKLQDAGFKKVKKVEEPLIEEGYVSLGTLFSDGVKTLSLSYADSVLMLTISMTGTFHAEKSFLKPSHITNIYQHSHATYNETDGIGIVTELYVKEQDKVQPKFTEFNGVAVVTLGNEQEYLYFGGSSAQTHSIGSLLKTGILGQSGDKGSVTVSGTAYATNALGGGGSFIVTYGIVIP